MPKLYLRTIYVPKTRLVTVESCGPKCGYWCAIGPRCNQGSVGGGLKRLPEVAPDSGFPEFCHLSDPDSTGELFA